MVAWVLPLRAAAHVAACGTWSAAHPRWQAAAPTVSPADAGHGGGTNRPPLECPRGAAAPASAHADGGGLRTGMRCQTAVGRGLAGGVVRHIGDLERLHAANSCKNGARYTQVGRSQLSTIPDTSTPTRVLPTSPPIIPRCERKKRRGWHREDLVRLQEQRHV